MVGPLKGLKGLKGLKISGMGVMRILRISCILVVGQCLVGIGGVVAASVFLPAGDPPGKYPA